MKQCRGCGADLVVKPGEAMTVCEYCKTINYNEAVLQRHISATDLGLVHNLLRLGLTAYSAGDYQGAKTALDKLLLEDSSNFEGWVYLALSVAKLANTSNYKSSAALVGEYLKNASTSGGDANLLAVGKSVSANSLAEVAQRIIERQLKDADKAYFSFESVDMAKAQSLKRRELDVVFETAEHALALSPDDLKTSGYIAATVCRADLVYGQAHSHKKIVETARGALDAIKGKNAELYGQLIQVAGYAPKAVKPAKDKSSGKAIAFIVFCIVVVIIIGAMQH